jgi:hypothetical protein
LFEWPKVDDKREQIAELERMVRRLVMQLDIVKIALGYSPSAGKESK